MSYRYPSISARLTGRKGRRCDAIVSVLRRAQTRARCHARVGVYVHHLYQLQRDNTSLCPWEVVKIPADMLSPFSPSFFLSSRLTHGGIHPFVYTRRNGQNQTQRNCLSPPPSICSFVEGRSIDSFISHAINKREEAWCINFRASKRNLASRIEFKSKPS